MVSKFFVKPVNKQSQALTELVLQFINADSWRKAQKIVTDNPQLLSNTVESIFDALIVDVEDKNARFVLQEYRQLLSQCRINGIEATFANDVADDIQPELATLLDEIQTITDNNAMPRRIVLCQQALTYTTNPQLWMFLQGELGNSYQLNTLGDPADNLEKAIECYQAVLQAQAMPMQRATTMNNLATAYLNRIYGTPDENLEKAIEYYQAILQVRNQKDMPVEWAGTMNNLGNIYTERISGTRADNQEQAIEYYQMALQVITPQDMPVEWASTMNNLAIAYSDRICGRRTDNLEKAINIKDGTQKGHAGGMGKNHE